MFVATNLETSFPQSPATIDHVHLVPNWPRTGFSPSLLPNTGTAHSSTIVTVPGDWAGGVYLDYRIFWDGPDGTDIRVGYADITLDYCFPSVSSVGARRVSSIRTRVAATRR